MYTHTQRGTLIIWIDSLVILLFGFILTQKSLAQTRLFWPVIACMLFVIFTLSSFVSLTITVNKQKITIRFGYGIFRKSFAIKNIKSIRQVRHRWYYGWGIRLWLWPKMWIYNVSGFDTIEIIMKNGKRYRIGTDEPKALKQAIQQAMKQ